MTNNTKIHNLLNEKIDEIFIEMQNELKIENGDVSPLEMFELDTQIKKLTNIIEGILNNQK